LTIGSVLMPELPTAEKAAPDGARPDAVPGTAVPAADASRDQWLAKAETLAEALPYMRRHAGTTFVIKYGGHAMGDTRVGRQFAADVVLLKQVGINPVVVHGGGPQIGQMLERLKIKSSFIDGLRVTDSATVEIVEMVLSGSINKQIVSAIGEAGGMAIGLSGKDGRLIVARKLRRTARDPDSNIEKILDLGFVGEPHQINAEILESFEDSDVIPVVAPIGIGKNGETYNINADTAAGAIAGAMGATRLLLLTDVPGVLDRTGALVTTMTADKARQLLGDGTISGGMIPKVETCLEAIDQGVEAAVILDGRVPHALLLEIFTAGGAGTMISAE
jgi:acetylglutamate kinase